METFVHDIQIMIASSLLLLGVIQLMYRNSGPLNRNLAVSFFSLGYILLYMGWLTAGERVDLCFLANTETAVTFFSGPAIFLSVTTIVGERPNPPIKHAFHYIFPTAVLILTVANNVMLYVKTGVAPTAWDYSIIPGVFEPKQWFSLLGNLWLLSYTTMTIVDALMERKRGNIAFSTQYLLFLAILCYLVVMSVIFVVTCFINAPLLMLAAAYLCGIFVIAVGLVGFRYPEYINRVLKAVSGQKKRKEILERKDADAMMETLVALMERDEAFRNPDLTIDGIAPTLGANAQIVSELINRKTGTNFRAWLNAWRILSACAHFARDDKTSILDIAFECGFNSKSAFNAAFQEIAGKTPREFRKAIKNAPGKPEAILQTLKLPSFVKSSVAK